MEMINNQYKIVREIHYVGKNFLSFVVMDFQHENKTLGLSIVKPDYLSSFSEEFIKKHFTQIKTMQNDLFFKNYDFGATAFESNGITQNVYYYTHELHEDYFPLAELIDPFNLNEILKTIVQICSCENLGIINGYVHPLDSIDDFFASTNGETFTVKANDLITLSLREKNHSTEYRFENIATLFLSLLDGYSKTRDAYENIQVIRETYKDQFLADDKNKILECILTVCENICLGKYSAIIYDFYYQVIADINKKLDTNFCIDCSDVYSYVYMSPITMSQEKDITRIIREITDDNLESKHNIFLITGNLGCGKTTFLDELHFLLTFEGVDSHFVSVERKSYSFFLKLLSNILDKYPILKHDIDLNTIYLQIKEFASDRNYQAGKTYSAVEKINTVIKKASLIKPQVIIIDNLNLADKFTLEFIFSNIMQGLNMMRIFFVLSFSKDFVNAENYFKTAYQNICKLKNCDEIKLNQLSEFETATLIKRMLFMRTEPRIIAQELNKRIGGNRYFTINLIDKLLARKDLWKNKSEGYWEIHPEVYNISHFFDIPDSIIELTKSVFSKYFTERSWIFKNISIFQIYIKKSFIEKLLPSILKSEIDDIFADFIDNNFISEVKPEIYRIDEKMLQITFYNSLTADEKKALHLRALDILKDETDDIFADEIFLHYDYLAEKQVMLDLLISKARKESLQCNYHSAIINYEQAYVMLKNAPIDSQVDIGVELATVYSGLGKLGLALLAFSRMEASIGKVENKKILLKYYFAYCDVLYEVSDLKKYKAEVEKLMACISAFDKLSIEEQHCLDKIEIVQDVINNERKSAKKKLAHLISQIETTYENKKILGELYRYAGNIEFFTHSFNDAYKFFQLSYINAKEYNDTKNMLHALNNIASMYMQYDNDLPHAEQSYLEALEIATASDFEQNVLICYVNLSMLYCDIGKLDLAEHYLSLAKAKLVVISFSVANVYAFVLLLTYNLLLKRNNYVKAATARDNIFAALKNSSISVLQEDFNSVFYALNANMNLVLCEYDECLANFKMARSKSSNIERKQAFNFEIELVTALKTGLVDNVKLKKNLAVILKISSSRAVYDLLAEVVNIISISIAMHKFNLFHDFALAVVEFCKDIFDKNILTNIRLKVIKAVLDEHNAEKYIIEAIAELKRQRTPLLEILVNEQLALHYFKKRKYAHGALVFINVEKLILDFMEQIPNDKKLYIFNMYAFKAPFQILYDFIKIGKTKITENVFYAKVSKVGFKRLLNSNDLKLLMQSPDFAEILLCEVFYANDDVLRYQTITETVQHFSNDFKENICLVLNFIMQKMFANYANILVMEKDKPERFIFPTNKNHIGLLDYEKALKEGGLDEIRNLVERYNFDLITVPIHFDKSRTKSKYKLLMCVQKEISILSNRRIHQCKKLLPLLNSLLSSYELNNILITEPTSGAVYVQHFEDVLRSSIDYSINDYHKMTVGYFRLENIKMIESFLGQQQADKIVKSVIDIVSAHLSQNDIVSRYASDEFAVLFYEENKNDILKKVEAMQEKIHALKFSDVDLPFFLTFGMASLGDDDVTVDSIVDKARVAMLYASSLGANKNSIYFPAAEKGIISQPLYSKLYSNNGSLYFDKINCILKLVLITSGYASTSAMIHTYLSKLLDFMHCETVSLVYPDVIAENDNLAQPPKTVITVKAKNFNRDVKINSQFLQQAANTMIGFCTEEVIGNDIGELNFPTWQSVLVCPILDNEKLKGFFYLTISLQDKSFLTEDLSFISFASNILGKEL
jgi:diguanylate cyclase (GGDEF) domain protein